MDIQQFTDRHLFKMGITVGAVMVVLSIVFLLIAKKYISLKDYSTLSYRAVERKTLKGKWSALTLVFLVLLLLICFIPYVGVALASFARSWSMSPLPTSWTTVHYEKVLLYAPGYIINTFRFCILAIIMCIHIMDHGENSDAHSRGAGYLDNAGAGSAWHRTRYRLYQGLQYSDTLHNAAGEQLDHTPYSASRAAIALYCAIVL